MLVAREIAKRYEEVKNIAAKFIQSPAERREIVRNFATNLQHNRTLMREFIKYLTDKKAAAEAQEVLLIYESKENM